MKLIDSHCHIHFNAYREDMDEVIQRTLDKGVFMITVGTQKDTSVAGLKVAEQYEGIWATIGLHPNHTVEQTFWDNDELPVEEQTTPKIKTRSEDFDYEYYKKLASHPKCVGIGETGLDWYRIPEGADIQQVKEKQRQIVGAQFDLATEMNLPVVIHCRDAYKEQVELVREYVEAGKLPAGGIIHCFTGTPAEAMSFVELGFFVSFSGVVTFPVRKREVNEQGLSPLQMAVRSVPIEKILVETDSPYLTPEPHRGERNEPWHVVSVAEKIAELKQLDVEEVAKQTFLNTKKIFKI
jgi:TatD DNase family protein